MKKVLIVDDNPAVLEVVSELISANGLEPLMASGGMEALQRAEREEPDLILLDINMPDLDGWSVLRSLKEKGITDRVQVMMLTATADIGADIFGLQDVVSGYIRKPFSNEDLSQRLKSALSEEAAQEEPEARQTGLLDRLRRGIFPAREPVGAKERQDGSAKRFQIRRGFAYVIKERKPVRSFEIFVDQVTHDIEGLCVTRQHPGTIRHHWGLEKTPIIWLSNKVGRVYVNPTSIGILSDTVVRFVEKSGDGIVLIDGIEFLMINNDFEKVLRMIHHITEAVMEYKSRLLISVDPRALDMRQMALLERNMEVIDATDLGGGASSPDRMVREHHSYGRGGTDGRL